jgi:hypothetical protein
MRGDYFKYMIAKSLWLLIATLLHTVNSNAVTPIPTSPLHNNYIDTSLLDSDLLKNALPQDHLGFYLFTHGRPGELLINDKWLGAEEIATFVKTHFSFSFGEMCAGQNGHEISTGQRSLNIYGCYFAKGTKGLAAISYLEKELDKKVAASTNLTGAAGDWITIFGECRRFDSTPSTYVSIVVGVEGGPSILLKNVEVMAFGGSCTWPIVKRPLTAVAVNKKYILNKNNRTRWNRNKRQHHIVTERLS